MFAMEWIIQAFEVENDKAADILLNIDKLCEQSRAIVEPSGAPMVT